MRRYFDKPPAACFAGIIPVQRVAARSESSIIVLTEIRCYRQGVLFELVAATRLVNETAISGGDCDQFIRTISPPSSEETPHEEFLRFTVSGAGMSASTITSRFHREGALPGDDPVVLRPFQGRGRFGPALFEYRQPLWLWPLPPPEPFELITDWPAYGISDARLTIDGHQLVQAAGDATPFWSDLEP